jgi:hypothetical protein
MSVFDQILDDVRKRARHKMECKIRVSEDQAALGHSMINARPKFSDSDKQALILNAESEAVENVLSMIRRAAFPDE